MAKRLLTCLRSSVPVRPKELDDARLLSSLVADLEELQKSLEAKPPSLQWCSEAISVVKRSHSRLLLHLEKSNVNPVSGKANLLDEYLRATLEVLDLCNLLKSAVSILDRYRMMINFMVKGLEDSSFSFGICKTELEKLEKEKDRMIGFTTWKDMNLTKRVSKVKLSTKTNSSSMNVLQAIRNTMSVIYVFILCSVVQTIPIKIDEGSPAELWSLKSDKDPIQKLITAIAKKSEFEQGKKKPILYENEMIAEAFAAFRKRVVSAEKSDEDNRKQSECADTLKNSSAALEEGIDSFESVVDELFEDAIKGRRKMINSISIDNFTA